MKSPVKVFCLLSLCALLGAGAALEASVVSLSPAAFRPADYWPASLNWYTHGDALYLDASPDATVFIATLQLPNEVLFKKFTAYVTVGTGAGVDDELYVVLERYNLSSGARDTLASLFSAGLPLSPNRQALSTSAISFKKVNDFGYVYDVIVVFHSSSTSEIKFNGVRIEY